MPLAIGSKGRNMTEADWLNFFDSEEFLESLSGDRKLRLFAVGHCRLTWELLIHQCSRQALEVAERFAHNLATEEELSRACITVSTMPWNALRNNQANGGTVNDWAGAAAGESANSNAWWAAFGIARFACWAIALTEVKVGKLSAAAEKAAEAAAERANWSLATAFALYSAKERQCQLLRDIFRNPFRPLTIDPRWLTSTVVDLATAIYQEKAFDRMPILADALTDAGCDNEEIIAHCRSAGPHVRGCWVVDLLLDKK